MNNNNLFENNFESEKYNFPYKPGSYDLMNLIKAEIIDISDIEYDVDPDDDGGYTVTMYCPKLDYLNEGIEQPKLDLSQNSFLDDDDALPF